MVRFVLPAAFLLSSVLSPHAALASPADAPANNSCTAGAQAPLGLGLAALYNFEYAESEDAFRKAAAADGHCAIAQWGIAMTQWHELWNPSDAAELTAGWKAAQDGKAREQYATARDKAYVEAIAAYFQPAEGSAQRSADDRADAYLAKMRALHAAYPADMQGTVFLALAIIADNDRGTRQQRIAHAEEAGALLQPVFDAPPEISGPARAGAAHYLIHAYDMPELAEKALPAARAYAKIAPDSPHALHMPSHIFAQLGLWDEDIKSNVASYEAAKSQPGHSMEKAHEEMHALDFMQFALLQLGNWAKAAEITQVAGDIGRAHQDVHSENSIVWLPMRQIIEHEDWADWEKVPQAKDPSDPYWKMIADWFQVMVAARQQDATHATLALHAMQEQAAVLRKKDSDGATLDVLVPEAEGWEALARGDNATAIAKMKSAAEAETKPDGYDEFRKPAEEMLADVYLATGDKADAHAAYAECLKVHPHRRLSTLGLQATA